MLSVSVSILSTFLNLFRFMVLLSFDPRELDCFGLFLWSGLIFGFLFWRGFILDILI